VVQELRTLPAGTGTSPFGCGSRVRVGVGVGAGFGSGVHEASSTDIAPAPAPRSRVRRVILIVPPLYPGWAANEERGVATGRPATGPQLRTTVPGSPEKHPQRPIPDRSS
jgi:hypothetical protein